MRGGYLELVGFSNAVKLQFRDMMSPSVSGSTIGQVLVKFLNFKHVNNHMIRHSVEQKQNGQHAKPFNRPMSVISFHKMGDFTYIGMYQTTHQYIYLLY